LVARPAFTGWRFQILKRRCRDVDQVWQKHRLPGLSSFQSASVFNSNNGRFFDDSCLRPELFRSASPPFCVEQQTRRRRRQQWEPPINAEVWSERGNAQEEQHEPPERRDDWDANFDQNYDGKYGSIGGCCYSVSSSSFAQPARTRSGTFIGTPASQLEEWPGVGQKQENSGRSSSIQRFPSSSSDKKRRNALFRPLPRIASSRSVPGRRRYLAGRLVPTRNCLDVSRHAIIGRCHVVHAPPQKILIRYSTSVPICLVVAIVQWRRRAGLPAPGLVVRTTGPSPSRPLMKRIY
jgi:hypothetical protein